MDVDTFERMQAAIESCTSMATMATTIAGLRQKTKVLTDEAAQLKELEALCRAKLLVQMDAAGQTSANFDGVARVRRTVKTRAEVRDGERFAHYVQGEMQACTADGRPASDALQIMQRRPAVRFVEKLAESGFNIETIGLALVETPDITVTLEKK